jgi:hypothetical protein
MMTKVLSIAMIQPMAMKTSHMARITPRIVKIIQPMAPPGYSAVGPRGGRSVAGDAVDPLPDEVGVAVVARVLLDHVQVDPADAPGALRMITPVAAGKIGRCRGPPSGTIARLVARNGGK